MSDTADEDDGIDKEALREELREKYERDEREREATRRMSDLLLKGATMTNSHCGTCHDPLFRQDGVTFCPTCHGGPAGVEAAVDDTAVDDTHQSGTRQAAADSTAQTRPVDRSADVRDSPDAAVPETTPQEPRSPPEPRSDDEPAPSEPRAGAPTRDETGDSPARSSEEPPTTDPSADHDEVVSTDDLDWGATEGDDGWSFVDGDTEADRPASDAVDSDDGFASVDSQSDADDAAADTAATDVDAIDFGPAVEGNRADDAGDGLDLTAAYESQVRALERFSAEAADTDDPRYARECLGAAREAAKALAVLRALRS